MRRGLPRARRAGARASLAGCVLAALGIGAPAASAVIVSLTGGHTVSYQPLTGPPARFDAFFSNLDDYAGDPVMASDTNYALYWRLPDGPVYHSDYQAGINRYLADLAHDSGRHTNVDSVATRYSDSRGNFANYDSRFGAPWSTPLPTRPAAAPRRRSASSTPRSERRSAGS